MIHISKAALSSFTGGLLKEERPATRFFKQGVITQTKLDMIALTLTLTAVIEFEAYPDPSSRRSVAGSEDAVFFRVFYTIVRQDNGTLTLVSTFSQLETITLIPKPRDLLLASESR